VQFHSLDRVVVGPGGRDQAVAESIDGLMVVRGHRGLGPAEDAG
jgi:hypothetical protein